MKQRSMPTMTFQPTLPVWGETSVNTALPLPADISTHSPRVGRDRYYVNDTWRTHRFQPTLPVWGETEADIEAIQDTLISTHSPRVGRDLLRR